MVTEVFMPIELPACKPGDHVAAIISGGLINYWNKCGKCGRQIERYDGVPWMTQDQVDELVDAMDAENRREMEDSFHPEWRCPPRE
jgi:hypothetical protein